jgi:Predicted membrane protein
MNSASVVPPVGAAPDRDATTRSSIRLRALVPWTILLLAAALRLLGLDKSVWLDEASSLHQAMAPDFLASARAYDHPPLYFALLRAGLHLTDSYTVLRLFSVACGLGAVAFFCFWPDRILRVGGWIAGLLLAVSPGFVAHSQELRHYALLSASFTAALAFAWRLSRDPENPRVLLGLGLSLLFAAATHLLTLFFATALAAWLCWSLRTEPPRRWLTILATGFLPALLLVVLLKTVFLQATDKTTGGWWMPAVTPELLVRVFRTNAGWDAISRFSYLIDDILHGTRYIVLLIAAGSGAVLAWIAFCHRRAGPALSLLAVAAIYWTTTIAYSLAVAPIVWPRTMLPGTLPCLLAVGLGVAANASRSRRLLAAGLTVALAAFLSVPWAHGLAWRPAEDLRGLTAAVRSHHTSTDLLVSIDYVDAGLKPYWPRIPTENILHIQSITPPAETLAALATHRSDPRFKGLLLLYREDLTLTKNRAQFDALLQSLTAEGLSPEELWNHDGYRVLRYR